MAFELIFGRNAIPGSEEIFEFLRPIKTTDDAKKFRQELRTRLVGGEQAVRDLKREICQLDVEAAKAKMEERFDEALEKFARAASLRGYFTKASLESTVEIMATHGQRDFATTLHSLTMQLSAGEFGTESPSIKKLMLGLSGFYSPHADTVVTINNFFQAAPDDAAKMRLYMTVFGKLLTSGCLTPEYWRQVNGSLGDTFFFRPDVAAVITRIADNLAAIDYLQMMFLGTYLGSLRDYLRRFPAGRSKANKQVWLLEVLKKIMASVISEPFLLRVAKLEKTTYLGLALQHYFEVVPYFDNLQFSFFTYCQALCLIMVSSNLVNVGKLALLIRFTIALAERIDDYIESNSVEVLRKIPESEVRKSLDLLLLFDTIAEADWHMYAIGRDKKVPDAVITEPGCAEKISLVILKWFAKVSEISILHSREILLMLTYRLDVGMPLKVSKPQSIHISLMVMKFLNAITESYWTSESNKKLVVKIARNEHFLNHFLSYSAKVLSRGPKVFHENLCNEITMYIQNVILILLLEQRSVVVSNELLKPCIGDLFSFLTSEPDQFRFSVVLLETFKNVVPMAPFVKKACMAIITLMLKHEDAFFKDDRNVYPLLLLRTVFNMRKCIISPDSLVNDPLFETMLRKKFPPGYLLNRFGEFLILHCWEWSEHDSAAFAVMRTCCVLVFVTFWTHSKTFRNGIRSDKYLLSKMHMLMEGFLGNMAYVTEKLLGKSLIDLDIATMYFLE